MLRHGGDPTGGGAELEVTPALADLLEADTGERADGVSTRDPRKRWAHVGMSTGVMMSGSGAWSSGWSSK